MVHYTASIETQLPRAEAFAYLSDFSNTEEWDPGIVQAERVGRGPVGDIVCWAAPPAPCCTSSP